MNEAQPISNFFDLLSSITPEDIERRGFGSYEQQILSAYEELEHYILHAVFPDMEDDVDFPVPEREWVSSISSSELLEDAASSLYSLGFNVPIPVDIPTGENDDIKEQLRAVVGLLKELVDIAPKPKSKRARRIVSDVVGSLDADETGDSQLYHFTALNINKGQAERLYDLLLQKGLIDDTGKAGFVYRFTGKGEESHEPLIWKGDAVLLSILMKRLSGDKSVPWKELPLVFKGLNIKSMKSYLSKSRKDEWHREKYETNRKMIDSWYQTLG